MSKEQKKKIEFESMAVEDSRVRRERELLTNIQKGAELKMKRRIVIDYFNNIFNPLSLEDTTEH